MATKNDRNLSLLDLAKRTDPDGAVAKIIEVMTEQNDILQDAIWKEGNTEDGNKTTIRTGLPQATWRKLYKGVEQSKSTTAQITDTCGMLEAYSDIDRDLVEKANDKAQFRESEDMAFIEGMNQQLAKALIYGDSSKDSEKIMGFAPRYNDSKAKTAANIIDAGGTGNNLTSMWLIGWGDLTVHGIFPKGSKAGMQVKDKGLVDAYDKDGNKYEVYETHFKFDPGLTVRDWRYVVRIANIPQDLKDVEIIDLINEALETIPNLNACKPAFYCNRKLRTALRNKIRKTDNVHLSLEEINGKKVVCFDGVPVRRVDAINYTESRVA